MTRKKEAGYREEMYAQGPTLMTAQTQHKLESELENVNRELKEKSEALGATQDSAQDWHDNAAYDTLLQQLEILNTQHAKLSAALKNPEIIKPRTEVDTVQLGNTVKVKYRGEKEPQKLTLLGPKDNGTNRNWISLDSPIGKVLIGQKIGSVATMPNGMIVEIVEILPGDFE